MAVRELQVTNPSDAQFKRTIGSGALAGKMLLIRIIKNNIIDAYIR